MGGFAGGILLDGLDLDVGDAASVLRVRQRDRDEMRRKKQSQLRSWKMRLGSLTDGENAGRKRIGAYL